MCTMKVRAISLWFTRFIIAIGLLFWGAISPPFAQAQDLTPELDELRRSGWDAVYNMDFDAARAEFTELQQRAPQHPVGDLLMASLTWIEQLNRSRRLQINLYRTADFYAGAKPGKDTGSDVIPAEVDKAFRQYISRALTKAQALVKDGPKDAEAVYFLGSVYGVLAGYEASATRQFSSAMSDGKKSVKHLKEALKLDPELYDAYMAVGLFDYVIGSLPWVYRTFAFIGGFSGDKEEGIGELKLVVEKGKYNRDDATLLLIVVYRQEGKFHDALALLQSLSDKYPRNHLFKLETATIFASMGRFDESAAIYDSLLSEQPTRDADLIHFQYGETLAVKGDYAAAVSHFLAMTMTLGAEENLATRGHLRAGQMYDLAGKRDEAIAQYKIVLSRGNVFDSREQAQRGLKQPYKTE
jgi:tetratricopeptide (TPR) repeat protein